MPDVFGRRPGSPLRGIVLIPLFALLLILLAGAVSFGQELSLEDRELFFEPPRELVGETARFPDAHATEEALVLLYQEITGEGEDASIYVSVQTSKTGRSWTAHRRVIGPIPLRREPAPVVFASNVAPNGDIYVVVAESATTTRVYRSENTGESFSEVAALSTEVTSVSPRLFVTSDGGLLLYVNQNIDRAQSILFSRSAGGDDWSEFEPLVRDDALVFNFLPDHVSYQGRDYVVFQSFDPNESTNYQLYAKVSENGGRSWSDARIMTDFMTSEETREDYLEYDNQRPDIAALNGTLAVVWERAARGEAKEVFYGELTEDGAFRTTPERASLAVSSANFPRLFRHRGETYVVWFTNPRGNSNVTLAARSGGLWLSTTLNPPSGVAAFARPLLARGRLHVFWQYEPPDQSARISYLEPDQRATPPDPRGANFVEGRRSSAEVAEFSWSVPEDPSGIQGYNYVWSRNPEAPVPLNLAYSAQDTGASLQAPEDGPWYFRIAARDRAGNWSEPSTLEFFRDTTPPPPVTFERPAMDEEGYLASNSFTLGWNEPEAPDVAGYTVAFDRVGTEDAAPPPTEVSLSSDALPQRVLTTATALSRTNADNGLWRLSVAPVDEVGNVGEARSVLLRLNKYIPSTQVFRVATEQDILGRYRLSVTGRGFTANGTIDRLILDRDGVEPYDYEFRPGQDYRLVNNRRIEGLTIRDIDTGSYRLGLRHSERGTYFPPEILAFERTGVITFGDYTVRYAPDYSLRPPAAFVFQGSWVLVWIVAAIMFGIVAFSSVRIAGIVRDGRILQQNAHALITGNTMPAEKKRQRLEEMKRTGIGLRLKFALFVVVLVVSVVVGVAFVLGNASLERQQATLGRGLEQRIEVLLRSVSSRAESAMLNPNENRLDLQLLTGQSQVMDEILYVTFSGPNVNGSGTNYVWATNDPAINPDGEGEEDFDPLLSRSLDTDSYVPGQSRLEDPASEEIAGLFEELNGQARTALGETPRNIQQLNEELTQLVLQGAAEDDPELLNLDETRRELELQLTETLNRIGNVVRSSPELDAQDLPEDQRRFVFYTPIMAWNSNEDPEVARYYRGTVRMVVSTDLILQEIADAQQELLVSTVIVAAIAVAIGIVGSLILATIVVIPINRLVRGVELIRDTEDKEELQGHVVDVRTRDELSVLANTVNSMTQGLVRAAATNKELTVGKEVQKMFIPLEEDNQGRKMTTVNEVDPGVELAGYYEGASAVSGDYFRYDKVDDHHYAMIKCDISGHGVAAALIMVQVATLYTSFFREWQTRRNGQSLTDLVVQVNDIIESMSFKGRFAAFTLGLLDTRSGEWRICNAGDNRVDILDGTSGRMDLHKLPDPPAAGVFPSDLVEMRGGFPEVKLKLKSGDTAILYTDGIEEAMHVLRNRDYSVHAVTEEDHQKGIVPGEESEDPRAPNKIDVEQEREEFGTWRIYDVVEALHRGGEYRLERLYDPDGLELVFDFRNCEASPENIVLALVSVEKVFRLYKHPGAGSEDRVRVDTKIVDFLRRYFRQYDAYFDHPLDISDLPEYRYFSHLREDEQEDDLTVLAVRKQ